MQHCSTQPPPHGSAVSLPPHTPSPSLPHASTHQAFWSSISDSCLDFSAALDEKLNKQKEGKIRPGRCIFFSILSEVETILSAHVTQTVLVIAAHQRSKKFLT